jgi:hypothetical protein
MAHWTKELKRELGTRFFMGKNVDLAAKLRRMDMMKQAQTKNTGTDRITGTDGHIYSTSVRVSCIQCGKLATPDKASHIDGSVEWTCHTCYTPKGFRIGAGAVLADITATETPAPTQNITLEFLKAGKAVFTVDNGKGTHYTYKVTRKEDKDRVLYFVNLLTGPDNTSNYTYMGMLVDDYLWNKANPHTPERVYCKMTRASKFNTDSTPVKVLNWALDVIQDVKVLPKGYSIQHDGRCARCSRVLTDPDSIRLGLGPVCRDLGY